MDNNYSLTRAGKGSRLIATASESALSGTNINELIGRFMKDGYDIPSNEKIAELLKQIATLAAAPAAADSIISVTETATNGTDPLEVEIGANDLLLVMTVQRLSGADNFITVTSSLLSEVLLDNQPLDSRPSNDFLLWPANYSRAVDTVLTLDISSECRIVYWVLSSGT